MHSLFMDCYTLMHSYLPHLMTENVRFPQKTSQICVIARPQSGRGNLKAEGMASRGEARERKTKEIPNFESSRSDTATVFLRKRRFTRVMPARRFLHFTLARLVQLCKYCFFSVCTMSTYSARQSS